jgi:hypothetical protein
MSAARDLSPLFAPSRIAVVGAYALYEPDAVDLVDAVTRATVGSPVPVVFGVGGTGEAVCAGTGPGPTPTASEPEPRRRSRSPGCGESVGILARLGAAVVVRDAFFLPYVQLGEPTRRK